MVLIFHALWSPLSTLTHLHNFHTAVAGHCSRIPGNRYIHHTHHDRTLRRGKPQQIDETSSSVCSHRSGGVVKNEEGLGTLITWHGREVDRCRGRCPTTNLCTINLKVSFLLKSSTFVTNIWEWSTQWWNLMRYFNVDPPPYVHLVSTWHYVIQVTSIPTPSLFLLLLIRFCVLYWSQTKEKETMEAWEQSYKFRATICKRCDRYEIGRISTLALGLVTRCLFSLSKRKLRACSWLGGVLACNGISCLPVKTIARRF